MCHAINIPRSRSYLFARNVATLALAFAGLTSWAITIDTALTCVTVGATCIATVNGAGAITGTASNVVICGPYGPVIIEDLAGNGVILGGAGGDIISGDRNIDQIDGRGQQHGLQRRRE